MGFRDLMEDSITYQLRWLVFVCLVAYPLGLAVNTVNIVYFIDNHPLTFSLFAIIVGLLALYIIIQTCNKIMNVLTERWN